MRDLTNVRNVGWTVRVLLDECLPRPLARELTRHDVVTVTAAGWSGLKNGALLGTAAETFDVLITIDRRFAENRPLPSSIEVITVAASSNRIDSLRPLVPALRQARATIQPGERVRLGV